MSPPPAEELIEAMTEPRYTSPIPPYQAPGDPQDTVPPRTGRPAPGTAPLEGVVLGGPSTSGSPRFGAGPSYRVRPRPVRQKSLLLAGLLALLFPPIGMLYGTIFGTVVMSVVMLLVTIVTAGHGLAVVWPVCIIWAVWGAHRTNQRRLAWAALGF